MAVPLRFSAIGLVWICLSALAAAAWDFTLIRSFEKPGANPLATLARQADGSFYGTTSTGGANGAGTLFRINSGTLETVRHFLNSDGSGAVSPLVAGPGGLLYGTATAGGALGFGTVFSYQPATGAFSKLLDFNGTNGSVPGGLMLHPDGALYGVTRAGGTNGHGTVFKLTSTGQLTTLHHFAGSDGSEPVGSLIAVDDQLYGLTRVGGSGGLGTSFRIQTTGSFASLFSFTGTTGIRPGANPAAGMMLHSSGKLIGTTEFGGSAGFGTAFSLTTAVTPVFALLHAFSDPTGSQPAGLLVEATDTHLYGTSSTGGTSGIGTLFRMTATGTYNVLHHFSGPDGAAPRAGLAADADGLLHGITSAGGPEELGRAFTLAPLAGTFTATAALSPVQGYLPSGAPVADGSGKWLLPLASGGSLGGGTVLRYDPAFDSLTPTAIGGTSGETPDGALTLHNGNAFGVCARGGASARGSAFSFNTTTGAATLLASFNTTQGSLPEGPLIPGSDGALYGVSREGGASARGTFYKITTAGTRTRIFSFTGTTGTNPGREPRGPIVRAANQSFYGATALGGSSNLGVIYKLNPLGAFSVIADFNASGPRLPLGGLVLAADGSIYGTCSNGGTFGGGVLVRIDPANDSWSVVASFDPAQSATPAGPLIATPDGAILGFTTSAAGGVFRYLPASGVEMLTIFSGSSPVAPGRASATDTSALVHHGGLALLPDDTILGLAPGGGILGGGTCFQLTPSTPLGTWKTTELGDPNAPDLGDPDQDGLANLTEYFLGSIPTQPSPAAMPVPVFSNGRLQITIPRDPAKPDVMAFAQVSSSPAGPWSTLAFTEGGLPFNGPGFVSGDSASAGLKSVLIRDTIAPDNSPRRFFRFRILTPQDSALVAWKNAHLADPYASDTADPDNDQMPTLLEYALGSDPAVSSSMELPHPSLVAGFLSLTVPRDPARSEATLTVEAASNPGGPWSAIAWSIQGNPFSGPGYISGETPGNSLKSILIRDTQPTSSQPSRFLRITATR